MCDPQRQDYFGSDRFDDIAVCDTDRVLRHCRTPVQIVKCQRNGSKVSDQALKPRKDEAGVSIDHECLLRKDALPPDHRYGSMPNTFALIALSTGELRKAGGGVAWTPKPDEPDMPFESQRPANPWHGEIIGHIVPKLARELIQSAAVVREDFTAAARCMTAGGKS